MKELEQYIQEKKVDGSFAAKLRSFNEPDLETLLDLIRRLKPSANTLRGIESLSNEICRRDSVTFSDLLSEKTLRNILENENLSRKHMQAQIVKALELKRFPERAKLSQELALSVKQLVKEYGLPIVVPDELEGDSITITVKARSKKDILNAGESLKALSEHPGSEKIFSLLLGENE